MKLKLNETYKMSKVKCQYPTIDGHEILKQNGYKKLDVSDLENCDEIFPPHVVRNPYSLHGSLFTKQNNVIQWYGWVDKDSVEFKEIGELIN